jgi:ABC-2 type transport system permease protein
MTNLRGIGGRAYPRVSGIFRERSWLIFEILLPFMTTSSFVFVYRALQAPPQYIGFVVLGGAMTAFWLNVMWMMAAQLYWEKDQGNLELYFTAPMSMMSILLGMAVGGLRDELRARGRGAAHRIAPVRRPVSGRPVGPLVGRVLPDPAALYGLGMMLASLCSHVGPGGVASHAAG